MWRWRCNILAELSGTTQFSMWRVDTHTHEHARPTTTDYDNWRQFMRPTQVIRGLRA